MTQRTRLERLGGARRRFSAGRSASEQTDEEERLQRLAKEAREASAVQQATALEFSTRVAGHVRDTQLVTRRHDTAVIKLRELSELSRQANVNYEMLRNRSSALVAEARIQKKVLDECARDANEMVGKLAAFKRPEETVNANEDWMKQNRKKADEFGSKVNAIVFIGEKKTNKGVGYKYSYLVNF